MSRKRKQSRTSKGAVVKDPLTPKQQELVIETAKKLKTYEGYNALHIVLFFLRTGAHPSVLSNKAKSSLKTTDDDHIQWSRPKKHGSFAITRVLIHKDLKPWIYDFVLQEFPDYREWYWRFCKEIGKKANIHELSPMSFRHTFGANLDDMGLTPAQIKELMNCSIATLMRYTKRQEKETDKKLKNGGW